MQNLLFQFFKLKDIPVTHTSLKTIVFYPEYPSLSALSDFLDMYFVPNMAVKITQKELTEIPYPAFAQMQQEELVLIKTFENQQVTYFTETQGFITENIADFSKKWTGKALLAEPNEASAEPNYKENKQQQTFQNLENIILYVSLVILLIVGVFLIRDNKQVGIFTGLLSSVVLGLVASVFLLINEFGKLPKIVAQMCHIGKETDCNAITKSAQAKLLGWLSWSEIGFLYFSGTFLVLLLAFFANKINDVTSILFILSALTLPYTLFSVYYQAFIVKKWCPLCLVVLLMLWSNTSFLSLSIESFNLKSFNTDFQGFMLILVGFLLPILAWFVAKPFIIKNKKTDNLELALQKYQRNTALFASFLQTQKTVEIGRLSREIILGNPDASTTLLSVCNPFCKPCTSAHKEIDNLVKHFEDVRFIVRFVVDNDLNSMPNKVLRHILSLENDILHKAIHSWFELPNYEVWSNKYPIDKTSLNAQNAENLLLEHKNWSNETQIEYTPTIFLNSKELTYPYDFRNLKYHLKNAILKNSFENA